LKDSSLRATTTPQHQHKHAERLADRLGVWADKVVAILADQQQVPQHIPLNRSCNNEASRARKEALCAGAGTVTTATTGAGGGLAGSQYRRHR
jgi:hypothetical protein